MTSPALIHWNLTKFLCLALPEKEGLSQAAGTNLLRTLSHLPQLQSDSALPNQQIPNVTSYSCWLWSIKPSCFVQLFPRLDASLFINQ